MRNKTYLKTFIVISMLACLIMPIFLFPVFGKNYQLIIHPIMWITLSIISFYLLPKYHYKFDLNRYDIRQYALIGALIYIIIYFSSGLIIGFTKSPYDRSFIGILKNLWMIESLVISKEFIRNAFFKTTTKQDKWFTIIFVTIIFVLLDLNLYTIPNIFESFGTFMGFMTKNLISAVAINTFVSYLTYRDGLKSALLFQVPYTLVFLLTPVFPANIFAVILLIETVIPLLIYLRIEKKYKRNNTFGLPRSQTLKDKITHYAFVTSLLILIAFSMGLLPYSPMVIASDSMYPLISRGDIIVMKEIPFENIKTGDIIEYKLDDIYVVHRVIEITETNNGKFLTLKGDNNASKDKDLVSEEQVQGIIVGNIPKLGYPTLWLKDLINGNKTSVGVETGKDK